MWHLEPDTIARLVDEAPDPTEAEHLAGCADCAAVLEGMKDQTRMLGELPKIIPAPAWDGVRNRLAEEGLLGGGAAVGFGGGRIRPWMRYAAALALFLAGGAVGAIFAGGDDAGEGRVALGPTAAAPAASPAGTVANDDDGATALRGAGDEQLAAAIDEAEARSAEPEPQPIPQTRPAGGTLVANASQDPARARTPEEALRLVRQTEDAYLAAMTRFAELTGQAQDDNVALRLATLDGIVVTTGAALREAPADPVINGYYLTARAQRDAVLRNVSDSRPAQF